MKNLVLVLGLGLALNSYSQYSPSMMKTSSTGINYKSKVKKVKEVKDTVFVGVTKTAYTFEEMQSEIISMKSNINNFSLETKSGYNNIITGVCFYAASYLSGTFLIPNDKTNGAKSLTVITLLTGASFNLSGIVKVYRAQRHLSK